MMLHTLRASVHVCACLAVLLLVACGPSESSSGEAPLRRPVSDGAGNAAGGGSGGEPDLVVVDRMVPLPARHREPAVVTTPEPLGPRHLSTRRRHAPALNFAGAESEVRWSVELTGVERLELGYHVTSAGDGSGVEATEEVELTVSLRQDGEDTPLFHKLVRPTDFPSGYRDAAIPLQDWEGPGELIFTSRPVLATAADRVGVSWVSPRLLGRSSSGRPAPNVIVLVIDTLRADRLELFGGERSAMPRTEARIRGGAAAFTRAYANAPWSLPSMATLLTGRNPGEHFAGRRTPLGPADTQLDMVPQQSRGGIELVMGGERFRYQMLHPSIPTLQEVLGARGYRTGALHHNGYINYPTNVLKGMDSFYHYGSPDAEMATDRALEWLEDHRESPFFLFLHYMDPHDWPTVVAKTLGEQAVTPYRKEMRQAYVDVYDELVGRADVQVDRLLAGLEAMGLGEDTYLVLTSDHGELLFDPPAGVGHGASLREPVLRVPLALWGPGIEPAVSSTRVSLVDVVPTLLDLLGHAMPGGGSGRSLLPVLAGTERKDRDLVSEYRLAGPEMAAFFSGPWKLLYDLDGSGHRLRNLERDPGEATNLAGRQPAVETRLLGRAQGYLSRSDARFGELRYGSTFIDQETIDSLRALGYIR